MPTTSTERRENYLHHTNIQTRWMDNDLYGHVNNVIYYSYFDTVINQYLIAQGGLDLGASTVIGLCVESLCQYAHPVAFPQSLEAGLRVAHLGRSSVKYELGIFAESREFAVANGHFVHVFVDRSSRQSVPIPDAIRDALQRIVPDSVRLIGG